MFQKSWIQNILGTKDFSLGQKNLVQKNVDQKKIWS